MVSFVISTHNRHDALLQTLSVLHSPAAGSGRTEVLVVDNASTDGTTDAVRQRFPDVRLFPQTVNRGPCSKNVALTEALGSLIVFLDDDSFPRPGTIDRMVRYFQADQKLGAAAFAVHLPNGQQEC